MTGRLHPTGRVFTALLSMDGAEADEATRARILMKIEEVEKRYADTEWQQAQWEASVIAAYQQRRFVIARARATGDEAALDFLLGGVPRKLLAEILRPIIQHEVDASAAALLRNDGKAALKSEEKCTQLMSRAGFRVLHPYSPREAASIARMQAGNPPFVPLDAKSFCNVLRIAAAISFFHINEGREPLSLEELTPKYLSLEDTKDSQYGLIKVELPEGRAPLHGDGRVATGIVWANVAPQDSSKEATGPRTAFVQIIVPTKSIHHEKALRKLAEGVR